MIKAVFFIALIAIIAPAMAQIRPIPDASDPQLQAVNWSANETVKLVVPLSTHTTIELGRTEVISNVMIGDPASWLVSVGSDGERLTVRALRADAQTWMTLRSNLRNYTIDLEAGEDRRTARTLRYVYPSDFPETNLGQTPASLENAVERYKFKGAASLRPVWIADDGERTYIRWADDQALPAVFAIDSTGRELTIDGQMRGAYYTIDRVWPRLVFRIDRVQATADRRLDLQR